MVKQYVDGFVIVLKKKGLEIYTKIATASGKLWLKRGALDYVETVGEDLSPDMGGMVTRPFPKLTKLGEDEVVIFSYIRFKSKAHRNKVNKAVIADPAMDKLAKEMDTKFMDMKKFSYGGFETIVNMRGK